MSSPLKKTFTWVALGLAAVIVLVAAGLFAVRLYTAPLLRGTLAQAERLQSLARDVHERVRSVEHGDFSVLPALHGDGDRIAPILDEWRQSYAGGRRPVLPVVPVQPMRRVLAGWDAVHRQLDELAARQQVLQGIDRTVGMLDETAASLLAQSEKIVRDLVSNGGNDRDVYFFSRQMVLIQRISEHLHALLKPAARHGAFAESPAYKALVGDAATFEHTLETALHGKGGAGFTRRDAGLNEGLRQNSKMFVSINRDIGRILGMVPVLQEIDATVRALDASSLRFARDGDTLAKALIVAAARDDTGFAALYLVAVAALLALFAYGVYAQRSFQGRLDFGLARNRHYRSTLSRLQPALERLARGKLAARGIDADAGMEGVIVPLNRITGRLRDTLSLIKGGSEKLLPLIERINAGVDRIGQDNGRQIEDTAAASATLNRALAAAEQVSSRVTEASRVLESLNEDRAAARESIAKAGLTGEGDARPGRETEGEEGIEALAERLETLTRGVEELSAMVLHLLVRSQDGGEAAREPVPYANRALQSAHQCSDALEELNEDLTRLREAAGRRTRVASERSAALAQRSAVLQDMAGELAAMDARSRELAALLSEAAALLGEVNGALLSVSDDLDRIHEYTMHSSNEAADALKSGKRGADLVEQIGRSVDQYDIMD